MVTLICKPFFSCYLQCRGKEESFLIVTNLSDKGTNSVCIIMLKLVDEITLKEERELIVCSGGSTNEFKNQGFADSTCDATKARVRE